MPAEITFRVPGRNNSSNIDIVALLAAAGKSIADSCLTEESNADDSSVFSSMEPVESDMVVIDGPRLEPVPEKKEETAHDDSDDDDTLFDDDPDEPEVPKEKAEQKEDTKEKHSFSFFGKKKKRVEEEPKQEVVEEEPEENDDPDNYNKVREKLGGWQSKLAKFFTPTEGYEKDEDDE